jgi:hypothetical protein
MSRFQAVIRTFVSPLRSLGAIADARFFAVPLLLWTLASVGSTMAAVPRIDFDRVASDTLDQSGESMTPFQREEAIARSHKIAVVAAYASSIFVPGLAATALAFVFWLGLKVAGGKPAFVPTLSVVSHAGLAIALKNVLEIPAVLNRQRIDVQDANQILPSNLEALMPDRFHGAAASVAGAADLFALWFLALLVIGVAHVAGVSRVRAGATVGVLWVAYVVVFKLAAKSLATGVAS